MFETTLAGENGKWSEQHPKVGPRDMLTNMKSKRKRSRGTVPDIARCKGMAMWASALDGQFKG